MSLSVTMTLTVVIFFCESPLTSKMWHQVSVQLQGDGNTIERGENVNYDTGKGPRIALNNNGVILKSINLIFSITSGTELVP